MIIAVVNLKGGVGKTTTAVHLAAGLHSPDSPVVLIDADPQASALTWAENADTPWETISLAIKSLDRRIGRYMRTAGAVHAIIDTPPGDLSITKGALLAADLIVIPLQPTGADVAQMAETADFVDAVRRETGAPAVVLLTRMVKGTVAARTIRETLEPFGLPILTAEVPQAQAVGMVYGQPVNDLGHYATVLEELKEVAAA
ncbi:ParA family protein [Agrococcus casei]|nr:ParA family protein [Agrococcus casei]